jgi:hypothetical protein
MTINAATARQQCAPSRFSPTRSTIFRTCGAALTRTFTHPGHCPSQALTNLGLLVGETPVLDFAERVGAAHRGTIAFNSKYVSFLLVFCVVRSRTHRPASTRATMAK